MTRKARNKSSPLDVPLNTLVSLPMKTALQKLSEIRQISMSDINRQALMNYLPMMYPEWDKLFEEARRDVKISAAKVFSELDWSSKNEKE